MELYIVYINVVFLFVLNVLFFFSGICLNSLVIISFWRSVQLRKKLCYFMIMVLSCCDLLAVATNNPLIVFFAVATVARTENLRAHVESSWIRDVALHTSKFLSVPILALLVMNLNQYLATYHPIFHRTSVTKKKLLTLLLIFITIDGTFDLMALNGFAISYETSLLIYIILVVPPNVFINYKLFIIARRSRRTELIKSQKFSVKYISSCLLALVCLVMFSIPMCAYVVLTINSELRACIPLSYVDLVGLWGKTIISMNATFNCLIFYWKNKILRTEGMKIFKSIKICR